MSKPLSVALDKIVSVSKARANLPRLLDEVENEEYFILSRRYEPKAALVDLEFLGKLMSVYEAWKRHQDFRTLEEICKSIPQYPTSEVEKDIAKALKAVRSLPTIPVYTS